MATQTLNVSQLLDILVGLIKVDKRNAEAPVRVESRGGGFTPDRVYIASSDPNWPNGYCIIETD